MYNLIFVDDEIRTISALNKIIPWEQLNIRVIGIFDNAVSAWQTIIDERPDILVTDLIMPVMGGLELITRAKEMYPPLECLVLSGYEEFELARGAISCGAREYLVKPCQKDELVESLKKCIKNIEDNRNRSSGDFEFLQSKTEELYDQLMVLYASNPDFQENDVRKLLGYNQDYAMLRDAAIMAVIQNEMSAQKMQRVLKKLAQKQSGDSLVSCVVEAIASLDIQKQATDAMVMKVVQYVDENYAIPSLNLQHVADKVIFLTPRYIGRRFLSVMNMKFSEYLLQVRMDKAISILSEASNLSAGEVAEKVGLGNNVQYFYRLFRQRTGMTIREYKDQIDKEA